MSVEVMSLVWRDKTLSGTELLLMLALADRADDHGVCYPSVDSLASKTRKSRRTVQETVATLEKDHKLSVQPNAGPNGTNIYRLNLKTVAEGGAETARGVFTPEGTDPQAVTTETGCSEKVGGVRKPVRKVVRKVVREIAPNTSCTSGTSGTIKEDSPAEAGVSEDRKEKTESEHHRFIQLWCAAFEQKFGEKYAFVGGRDGEAVKKLIGFGLPTEHLIRIAKAAWEHPEEFFCKRAASLTGYMSRLNEIRMELNALKAVGQKGLPAFKQLEILRDMKATHVCNPESVHFSESKMTAEARKEYADIKKKIMEIEHSQRQQALA